MTRNRSVGLQQLKQQALRQMKNPAAWRELADACLAASLPADAAAALEHLLRLQPKDWLAGFQLANQYYALSKYPEALDLYLQLMEQNPGSWEVRNNLALLLKLLGQQPLAEQCWLEAIDLKPDYLDALSNLGNLYRERQQFESAQLCFDAALNLAPERADLLTNLGLLYKEQGNIPAAIEAYRRALAQNTTPVELPYNYAIALIQSGEYTQGYAWYERRWQIPRLAERRQVYDAAMPEWQGEYLPGKTLLIWNEQGLGDMIQMARYLPGWKVSYPGCRILLRVDPALKPLFAGLEGVDQLLSSAEAMPPADYHLSAMSFPFRQHTEVDSIPCRSAYLKPDGTRVAEWQSHLGEPQGRLRVGIVWQSGQAGIGQQEIDRQTRSLPAEDLERLLQGSDVDWVSLQVGGEPLAPGMEGRLRSPGAPIRDFADTAAILSQLDALVSVDTAAAHLGGALGLPTLVLMRATGGNLFPASGDRMPWYPSMRLLRQQTLYDWQPVVTALPAYLATLAVLSGAD